MSTLKPYYQTELGTLYHGDCLEVMRQLPEKCVDLVVTSPPYDNLRTYKGYTFDFPATARALTRLLVDGGVIVWVVGDATINGSETGTSFRQALYFKDECGLRLHDTMIYKKQGLPKNHNRYEQDFEFMFVVSKGKPNTFNPLMVRNKQHGRGPTGATFRHDGKGTAKLHNDKPILPQRIKGNCWDIDCGYMRSTKYKDAFRHPAIFPEQLATDHIRSWSNTGDTIFDPFMGSGTTAVACEQLGRKWIGCDVSEEYCEISARRLQEMRGIRSGCLCDNIACR